MHTLFFYINTAIIYPATIYFFFTRQLTLRISRKWFLLFCILQQESKVLLMAYDVLIQKIPLLNLFTFFDDMLLTVMILILFQEILQEKVFIYCMTLLLQTLPAMAIVLLCSRLIDSGSLILRLISLLVWYIGYYFFIRFIIFLNQKLLARFRLRSISQQKRLSGILFLFYYGCEMAGLFTTIEALSPAGETPQIWHILAFVAIAACGGAVIIAVFNYYEDAHLQQELQMIRAEKDMDYQTLQRQERSLDALHKLKHDQQNHLLILQGLLERGETAEADRYVTDLIGRNEKTAKRWSLNRVADVILSDTAQRCETSGIRFDVEGQMPIETGIETADLSSLLFNLLDNAVDAAGKTEKGNRFVSVSFTCKAEQLILVIRNAAVSSDIESISKGISSKADRKGHGFGKKIVKEIVSHYDGLLEYKTAEGVVAAHVILHCPQIG
jgi:signal transduction histidine kinase